MSIIRVEKNSNYVAMNKTALNDRRLSWKAKGIMAYMLSMPNDWIFYIDELVTHSTDGKDSFRSGFKELKDNGYVERIPIKDEKTKKILRWETIVYEIPFKTNAPDVSKPQVDNPYMEKPLMENPTLLNINKLNNNLLNNDDDGFVQCMDVEKALLFCQKNGFGSSIHLQEKIVYWTDCLNEELVIHAMKLAVENNAVHWNYVEAVLKNWQSKKISSVADVNTDRMRYQNQQIQQKKASKKSKVREEHIPEWFNQRGDGTTSASALLEQAEIDFDIERNRILKKIGYSE